jgi:uncharacterized protein (DUF3820 family)
MRKWTAQELALFTLAEFAHHEGYGWGKRARRFQRWLHDARRGKHFGARAPLPMVKRNGRWLVALPDYLHWFENTLQGMFKAAYADVLPNLLTQHTHLLDLFKAPVTVTDDIFKGSGKPMRAEGRYIEVGHLFGVAP